MIDITYDGDLIYDPLGANEVDRLYLTKAMLKTAVNAAGELTMEAPAANAQIAAIVPMSGLIEVEDEYETIFRGRPVSMQKTFDGSIQVRCEGMLAALNDSIVPPFNFPADFEDDPEYAEAVESGNVVEYWLGKLIDAHNEQTAADQHVTLGDVTVTDPNNYIARSSEDYSTTWSVISSKLQQSSLGGYLIARYEYGSTYLDYLAEFEQTNTQEVHFAENLLDLTESADATGVYTDIIPIGADGLTLEALEDGAVTADIYKQGNRLYSVSGRGLYGKITRVVEFEDVTLATNLRTKAAATLAIAGIQMPTSLEISAADLSSAESEIGAFRSGEYVRVISDPHGLSALYELMEVDRDLIDPMRSSIKLGATTYGIAQSLRGTISRINDDIGTQRRETRANAESIGSLAQITQEQFTAITQTTQEIVLSALEDYAKTGDLETLQRTLVAQIDVKAGEVAIQIRDATDQQIATLNGEMQRRFAEFLVYFRFTENGLFIGKDGNALELQVINDRVSFLDNGFEVAYFSDRKLYVTDGEFLRFLQIGHFRFIPRQNGNLSLIKVG